MLFLLDIFKGCYSYPVFFSIILGLIQCVEIYFCLKAKEVIQVLENFLCAN